MDAVSGDQQVGACDHDLFVRAAFDEARADFAIGQLLDLGEMMARPDPLLAEPISRRAQQDHLQIAAMDRQLRPGIASRKSALLAPDLLPELVEIDELAGRDRALGQRLQQPAVAQHFGRVRQQIDADPERTQALNRLVDARLDADALQRERGGEPANTSTDDDDVHDLGPAFIRPSRR